MRRRTFILTSGATALATQTAAGANDRINIGVAGLRSRGREHVDLFSEQPNTAVAALCDVDLAQMERAAPLAARAQGYSPKSYQDFRRMLEDKDIDAVSLATTNHWHALGAVWACQAGKDVYVEKPVSHNIWEGRRMVEAAQKYGRVMQAGMQGRAIAHKRRAIEMLREGILGKIYLAKGLCYKRRRSIGRQPETAIPSGVDYDLWLGPAPARTFQANRFHYNWHWFWDTGNGDIANQGVHEMDMCRWGLGRRTLPAKVHSTGGKFAYDDDQETPNMQLATYDYGDGQQIMFEVRGLLTAGEGNIAEDAGNYIGNLFFGSEGYMSVDSRGVQVFLGEKRELAFSMKATEARLWDTGPLVANFLNAVRDRKPQDLACPIEEGHLSAALCHMANISYRTGRQLVLDPAAENFGSDYEANLLLSRDYRAPFVVPAVV